MKTPHQKPRLHLFFCSIIFSTWASILGMTRWLLRFQSSLHANLYKQEEREGQATKRFMSLRTEVSPNYFRLCISHGLGNFHS